MAFVNTTSWNSSDANRSIYNNLTATSVTEQDLSTTQQLLIFAFSFIIFIGVVGNSLVVYVFGIRRTHKVKSSTEWLILYLGCVDLLASLFNPSLYIYWIMTRYKWHFGYFGCKILPAIGPITTSTSSAFLLILALDRYLAIVSPFRRQLSWKSITTACVIAIVISILSYFHYIYFMEFQGGYCLLSGDFTDQSYGIPNCTLVIIRLTIFAFVFTYTNIKIFTKLQSNKPLPKNVREKRVRQSRCIMRVLLTMGVVFVLLVYPREIYYLLYNLYGLILKEEIVEYSVALRINSWLKVMHTSNSCANIFIYAHMQSRFRRSILKVFYNLGFCKTNYMRSELHSITHSTTKSRNSSRFSRHKRDLRNSKASNQSSPLIKSRRESKDYSAQSSPISRKKLNLDKQISFQNSPCLSLKFEKNVQDSPVSILKYDNHLQDSPKFVSKFDNQGQDSPLLTLKFESKVADEATTFFQRAQIWKMRITRDSGYVTDV